MSFLQTNTSEKSSVQVAVRVRPINTREVDSDTVIDVKQNSIIIKDPSDRKKKNFNFDYAFDSDVPQETIFEHIGEKVVTGAYSGYNCCIFAYGQSGSGKSYSVLGSHKEPGLIPRICQALFDRQPTNNGISVGDAVITYKIELSYLEIYSEEVKDLLAKSHPHGGLRVRQHPELGPYVEGLSQVLVEDYSSIKKLIDAGNKERATASTILNDRSSRSHAICTLYFTQLIDEVSIGKTREVVSKINLVDLAGSERVAISGVTGINFKEAININQSLSTLGLVISKLAEASTGEKEITNHKPITKKSKSSKQLATRLNSYDRYSPTTSIFPRTKKLIKNSPNVSPSIRSPNISPSIKSNSSASTSTSKSKNEITSVTGHIPFRDSVLTWILKESLGGNSKTFMLATVSPSEINYNESLSTLRYAYNAKQIVNTVKVNEDPSDKLIRVLKGEIETLRQQLSMKGADSTTPALELKQLKEELAQREELMREKDKSWEQKLSESKRINNEVQESLKQELLKKQLEYEKSLEIINREKDAITREMELLRNNTTDKTALEEELAKKQAEFEKGRIVDTAVSLQEYYEKKIEAIRNTCDLKISDMRVECDNKIQMIRDDCNNKMLLQREELHTKLASTQLEAQKSIEVAKAEAQKSIEVANVEMQTKLLTQTNQSDQKISEELKQLKISYNKLKEEHNKQSALLQQQTKQFMNERTILSRQIQQLQAKIHTLETGEQTE